MSDTMTTKTKADHEARYSTNNGKPSLPGESAVTPNAPLSTAEFPILRSEPARGAPGRPFPTVIPIKADPEWEAAAEKGRQIGTEWHRLQKELEQAAAELSRGYLAHRDGEVEAQAQAILDGRPVEAFAGFEELRSRQARLRQGIAAHGEALRRHREQSEDLRYRLSVAAAEQAAPAHKAAAREVAEAIVALRTAIMHERMIRKALTDAGYQAALPNLGGPFGESVYLTSLAPNSEIGRLAEQAAEYAR